MFPTVSGMMEGVHDWARLAERVKDARDRHNQNRDQLAEAAGISARLLGDIERAVRDNYDRRSLNRLERALGWKQGSIDAILDGGEPLTDTQPADAATNPPDLDDAIQAVLADQEHEIRGILASEFPTDVKMALIDESRNLHERQIEELRALFARQAAERAEAAVRRDRMRDWLRLRGGGTQPIT